MRKYQIEEISNLLLEYSSGNYYIKGEISEKADEIDMIIAGINMMGEELLATNVSKDYFTSIFNSVTDLIFVLDENFKIHDVNTSVESIFNIDKYYLTGIKIQDFIEKKIVEKLSKILNSEEIVKKNKAIFEYNDVIIVADISLTKIINKTDIKSKYLLIAKDITNELETEKIILRTIVDTQQKEQHRMADELHDSLGQELSMTKLMISNLESLKGFSEKQLELLEISKKILDEAISHLREICFDLMPSVIIKGNLNDAIVELLSKLKTQNIIKFKYINLLKDFNIKKNIEIMIYRIIQEFINNSIKYSASKLVKIKIYRKKDIFCLELKDDGIGFDIEETMKTSSGRGIQNLKSKVEAFNGDMELKSEIGKGVTLNIYFNIYYIKSLKSI